MYHEKTQESIVRRRKRIIILAVVAVLVAVLATFGFGLVQESMRSQGASSMRETILKSAMQCCAIEGSYPQSLKYLEENYGLNVNHDDYVITYEAFASNIAPSVVVMPR